MPIELNKQFKQALDLMEKTNKNVFVTGRAGTGKSTLLNYFRFRTKKRVVVLAPTGVAAVNVEGQTIHSFFGFKPDISLEKVKRKFKKNDENNIYRKIDAIVIDEISMVRADLLDCVDKFLRLNGPEAKKPFGGIQMIFFGDLYQLPPVLTSRERKVFRQKYESEYFFSAQVFSRPDWEFAFVELKKIYRQKDDEFIRLLNAIRNNSITEEELALINQRYQPNFREPANGFYVYLTPTNKAAREINEKKLKQLRGRSRQYQALVRGEFAPEYYPTEPLLKVKKGAQVMMLNNDSAGRWVNGTLGKIIDFEVNEEGEEIIVVELDDGEVVGVFPYTWDIFHFSLDKETGELVSRSVGSFTQYPLKLAWAVTIHKSQGKTFERTVIDIGRGTFAHGQMYVALSRCVSLEGIILKKPISKKHIWMDWRVVKFLTQLQYSRAEKEMSLEEKVTILKEAIKKKNKVKITYLKPNDTKSTRLILPKKIGEMEYLGKPFLGLKAFCLTRQDDRVFRVDRILRLEVEE